MLRVDKYAVRRRGARHQPSLAQRIHACRGAVENAGAVGRPERRVLEQLGERRVWAPLECNEEAAVPLANGPGPNQIWMVDRRAGGNREPQPSSGGPRWLTRLEGDHRSEVPPIPSRPGADLARRAQTRRERLVRHVTPSRQTSLRPAWEPVDQAVAKAAVRRPAAPVRIPEAAETQRRWAKWRARGRRGRKSAMHALGARAEAARRAPPAVEPGLGRGRVPAGAARVAAASPHAPAGAP
jgi:hypothetical protein